MIEEHLALAKGHAARGQRIIEEQHRLIAWLEQDGHDTSQARALLREFEQMQALHLADRDRLEKELEAAKK